MSACLLIFCMSLGPAEPASDRFFAEDKWKHFVASFVVTSVTASAAHAAGLDADESVIVGAAAGVGAGFWKELRDARQPENHFSFPDLVWDMAGIGAASATMSQVR